MSNIRQTLLNNLLYDRITNINRVKSNPWLKPDKPFGWGERRDGIKDNIKYRKSIQKMKSEAVMSAKSSKWI